MHRTPSARRLAIEAARLVYGAAQLVAPGPVARSVGAQTDDVSLRVRRVLGLRHLVQGAVLLRAGGTAHRVGALVDVTHAASMFLWAATHTNRRRGAILNGLSAAAFALAETLR